MPLEHENDSTKLTGEIAQKSQAESQSAVVPTPAELRQGQFAGDRFGKPGRYVTLNFKNNLFLVLTQRRLQDISPSL